jgi:hypothetical protein
VTPRADEARTVLQDILQTPEFARAAGPSHLEALGARIRQLLIDVLNGLGADGTTVVAILPWLAWAAVAAALAVLILTAFRLRARRHAPRVPARAEVELRRSSSEWLARVASALDSGDMREAIRVAHLAAIVRLEEQGLWRTDSARTPREYVRLLPGNDARSGPFTALTREFERVWYGGQRTDGAEIWSWLEGCGCRRQHPAT